MMRTVLAVVLAACVAVVGLLGFPGIGIADGTQDPEELACQAYEMCQFECDRLHIDDIACSNTDWDLPPCDDYDVRLREQCFESCDWIPGVHNC